MACARTRGPVRRIGPAAPPEVGEEGVRSRALDNDAAADGDDNEAGGLVLLPSRPGDEGVEVPWAIAL